VTEKMSHDKVKLLAHSAKLRQQNVNMLCLISSLCCRLL